MAMAMIELPHGHAAGKPSLLEGVQRARFDSLRLADDDPTIRGIEHGPENVIIPPRHSDLCTMVTITMFHGRALETKRRLYQNLVTELAQHGVPGDGVQVVVREPTVQNWSRAGTPASDTDPGFAINI